MRGGERTRDHVWPSTTIGGSLQNGRELAGVGRQVETGFSDEEDFVGMRAARQKVASVLTKEE